ncbi:glutamate-cysteine ligase-domain-containing protein [Lanmaoa asiatica]|nr:glutamate-cysteine ligase-domain-containing protein [Lanmaoa asiatica]
MSIPKFHHEYGRYMLESTPGSPYTGSIQDLLSVESNMHYRRALHALPLQILLILNGRRLLVRRHLNANELPITVTSFPRMGAPGVFTDPYFSPDGARSSHSLFLPEEITNPHARFPTLTANIRTRRGSKVAINIPIFIDERTPRPFVDPTIPWQRSLYAEDAEAKKGAALIDHIYMDAMGFGAGCCCLQVTLQSCNVEAARRVYDALIPVGPIMSLFGVVISLTLTVAGVLPPAVWMTAPWRSADVCVDLYLSTDWNNKPAYNDADVPYNQEIYTRLVDHGIDELLSKHIAHIFIRDPLVIFSETIDQDDETSNDHFENLQSTNWQTLRFKPPPPKSPIGWRVEFRSMEVQLTDFENAAFAVFVVLLSRAILAFNLNFYIPISKVEENMVRAQKRDAVGTGKFFFRKNVLPPGYISPTMSTPSSFGPCSPAEWQSGMPPKERKLRNCFPRVPPPSTLVDTPVEDEYEEMSMEEIFNGKVSVECGCTVLRVSELSQGATFPGLVGLVEAYLETLDMAPSERWQIDKYIDLVHRSLLTTARWMREFVRSHPSYKFDSVVSQEINYDLMVAVDEIERGVLRVPQLLPQDYSCGQAKSIKPMGQQRV